MAIPRHQLLNDLNGPLEKMFEAGRTIREIPHCLVQVTLKDGTTQDIIATLSPYDLRNVAQEMHKTGMLTLVNSDGGIIVMADLIKSINVMKFTKE